MAAFYIIAKIRHYYINKTLGSIYNVSGIFLNIVHIWTHLSLPTTYELGFIVPVILQMRKIEA